MIKLTIPISFLILYYNFYRIASYRKKKGLFVNNCKNNLQYLIKSYRKYEDSVTAFFL